MKCFGEVSCPSRFSAGDSKARSHRNERLLHASPLRTCLQSFGRAVRRADWRSSGHSAF
jgi:hypothetical protein